MPDIEIDNVGPVSHFEYRMDPFGVHILYGFNGSGKSSILRTVKYVTDGSADLKPTKHDGAKRGRAEIAGKIIRITEKQIRDEGGELEVQGLEKFSMSDLHWPDFESVVVRDKHRIKSLCQIAGAAADPALFYYLLGGQEEFDEVVPRDVLETDDLVEMSSRVKAHIETASRAVETLEQSALTDAVSQDNIAKGVDLNAPHDEAALQDAFERAIAKRAQVKEKRAAWRTLVKGAEEARRRIAEIESKAKAEGATPPKSISEATADIEAATQADTAAMQHVLDVERGIEELKAQLRLAEQKLETAKSERRTTKTALDAANDALGAAKNALALRGELDAQIALAEGAVETTEDEVDEALEAEGAAKEAVAMGFRVRAAIEASRKAKEHLAKAKEHGDKARKLRAAAEDTADVLTNSIDKLPGCPLKVKIDSKGDPRLVLKDSGEEFDRLSDGQRWKIVVQLASEKNRLVVLSQAAWGELDPNARAYLDELARERELYILTAQAADCALHCAPFSASQQAAE